MTFWYLLQVNTNMVVMNIMIDATTKDLSANASLLNNASANLMEAACLTCAASKVGNWVNGYIVL